MRVKSPRILTFGGSARWHLALVGLTTLCAPRLALGQTEPRAPSVVEQRPAAAEPEQQTRWYGWQTAAVDAAAVGFFAGAMVTFELCLFSSCNNYTSESLALLSLTTYAATPLVHVGHGRWGTAAASFGIRAAPFVIGVPLVDANANVGAPILLGGVLAAMIVDTAVLAREPVPPASARLQLTPVVDPRRRAGFVLVTRDF